MSRPKGSRNKPKTEGNGAEKPKAAAAGPKETPHQNSAPLNDDQQHALLDQSARSYAKALELLKREQANFKNACKVIKADGVKLTDVKMYLEAATEEGQAAIAERAEAMARIARWRGFPLGHQSDMFDDGAPETNRSFIAGKEAGMAGEPAKVPPNYDINGWMAGHAVGQAALLSGGIKQLPEGDSEFE